MEAQHWSRSWEADPEREVTDEELDGAARADEVLRGDGVGGRAGQSGGVHMKCLRKCQRERRKKINADRWAHPVRKAFRRGESGTFPTW